MPRSSIARVRLLVAAVLLTVPAATLSQDSHPASQVQLQFDGESVQMEMPSKGGRSLVEVRVGDAGPFDFLIDTGASVSVIDSKIASDLGLEVVGSMEVGAPGGAQVKTDRVRAPVLRVGGLEISGAEPITLDISQMTMGTIEGVLGLDLFREVLLTLDPSGGRAVVSRGGLQADGAGVIPLDSASGRIKFEMDVAGKTVPVQIDTGSPGGFTLPIELIEKVPTLDEDEQQASAGLVGGSRSIRIRTLEGSVSFAGLTYENPRVGFMDPSPLTGNIGSKILNDLVVTVDQKNGLLGFQRAEPRAGKTGDKGASEAPRRLGVRFRGTPGAGFTHVGGVDPGSLGEQAGFKDGDRLISLNGKPISEYDQAALAKLLRSTAPLRWEVERDGTNHVIEIP